MLVLSRSVDTAIQIGPNIRVKVLSLKKGRVKLGVEAPDAVHIWREELCPVIDSLEREEIALRATCEYPVSQGGHEPRNGCRDYAFIGAISPEPREDHENLTADTQR